MSRLVGDSKASGVVLIEEAMKGEKPKLGESRYKKGVWCWVWRSMHVWPTFGKPRQEHGKFKDSLGYIVRFFFIFVGF